MRHVETAEKQTYGQCFFSITGFLGNPPLKAVSRQGNGISLWKSTQNYECRSATTISTSETKGIITFQMPFSSVIHMVRNTSDTETHGGVMQQVTPKFSATEAAGWMVQRKTKLQNPVNASRKNTAHTGTTPRYGCSLP